MALSVSMALSGLSSDQFSDELKDIYRHGAVLLKSPSSSSISSGTSSAAGSSSQSTESGISSMSRSVESIIDYLIEHDTLTVQNVQDSLLQTQEKEKPLEKSIIYSSRDILDLGKNLNPWNFFKPAVLENGAQSFFENRSQFSRLGGAPIERRIEVECSDKDCNFQEPHYY